MNKLSSNQPLVSVIMPVYNAGDFLVPAIESILTQTYQNFEFIIVNDASTDGSKNTLKNYALKYPKKIKVINLTHNLNAGGDASANKAIQHAKGKYIARMDADDISLPTRLEKQVTFLEENSDIFLVGSNAIVIDKKGKKVGLKTEPSSPTEIYKNYFTFHPLIHPSLMYHRFHDGKPFRYFIRYNANNDYYTFFKKLCQGAKFANLEESLVHYRIHGKNDTFVHMKGKFMNTLRIRAKMVIKYGYKPSPKSLVVNFIQMGVILFMPERAITNLYLISKGIKKMNFPFSYSFAKPEVVSTQG